MKKVINNIKNYILNINFRSKKSIVSMFLLVLCILGFVFVKSYAYYYSSSYSANVYSGGVLLVDKEEAIINIYTQDIKYTLNKNYTIKTSYSLVSDIPDNGYVVNHTTSSCTGDISINNLDQIDSIDDIDYFDVTVNGKGVCNIYLDVDTSNLPVFVTLNYDSYATDKNGSYYNTYSDDRNDGYVYNAVALTCIDAYNGTIRYVAYNATGDNNMNSVDGFTVSSDAVEFHNNRAVINESYAGGNCTLTLGGPYETVEHYTYRVFGNATTGDCYERVATAGSNGGKLVCDHGKRIVGSVSLDLNNGTGINNTLSVFYPDGAGDIENYERFRIIGIFDTWYDSDNDGIIDTRTPLVKLIQRDGNLRDATRFTQSSSNTTIDSWLDSDMYDEIMNNATYPISAFKMFANAEWQVGYIGITSAVSTLIKFETNVTNIYQGSILERPIAKVGLPYVTDNILSKDLAYDYLHGSTSVETAISNATTWFDNSVAKQLSIKEVGYMSYSYNSTTRTYSQIRSNSFVSLNRAVRDFFNPAVAMSYDSGYAVYLLPGVFIYPYGNDDYTEELGTMVDPLVIGY